MNVQANEEDFSITKLCDLDMMNIQEALRLLSEKYVRDLAAAQRRADAGLAYDSITDTFRPCDPKKDRPYDPTEDLLFLASQVKEINSFLLQIKVFTDL